MSHKNKTKDFVQSQTFIQIFGHIVSNIISFMTIFQTRKPKLGRSKPYYMKYDNSGSNNKGKQLLSGRSTVKSTSNISSTSVRLFHL